MQQSLNAIAGFTIEQRILEELQSVYGVIPTANIRTDGKHGPRLEGNGDYITLADGQIFGARRGWVEIKAKTAPGYFRNWSRFEHGIDNEKYIEYYGLQEKTRMTVYIVICEVSSGAILMSDLNTLRVSGRPRIGTWPDMKKSINWDRAAFHAVGKIIIENSDLRRIKIEWFRKTLDKFFSQLAMIDGAELRRHGSDY